MLSSLNIGRWAHWPEGNSQAKGHLAGNATIRPSDEKPVLTKPPPPALGVSRAWRSKNPMIWGAKLAGGPPIQSGSSGSCGWPTAAFEIFPHRQQFNPIPPKAKDGTGWSCRARELRLPLRETVQRSCAQWLIGCRLIPLRVDLLRGALLLPDGAAPLAHDVPLPWDDALPPALTLVPSTDCISSEWSVLR